MITFVAEDGTGLSTATSYVTVEEADDIAVLNIHNSDDWLALPLDKRRNLLMYVSRTLDSRTFWNGTQVTATQALGWPRYGVTDKYHNTVSSAAIPYNVRWAVVELAKHTMLTDLISKSNPESIVSEVKADSISVKFDNPTNTAAYQFKTPKIVTDLLEGYGTVRNSVRKVTFGKLVKS